MKYRKLPVVIEAFKFTGINGDPIPNWTLQAAAKLELRLVRDLELSGQYLGIEIYTLEGTMTANVGDYIIKGVNGEIYPYEPDIFEKTYEVADETAPKNKDLEFIKKTLNLNRGGVEYGFLELEADDEIKPVIEAAENMARELATLKDGYKVAHELVETMRKEKLEICLLCPEPDKKKMIDLENEKENLREANAHKNAVIEDLRVWEKRFNEACETVARLEAERDQARAEVLKTKEKFNAFVEKAISDAQTITKSTQEMIKSQNNLTATMEARIKELEAGIKKPTPGTTPNADQLKCNKPIDFFCSGNLGGTCLWNNKDCTFIKKSDALPGQEQGGK